MKKLLTSYQEYVLYLVFGIATTMVNYVVYFFCKDILHLHYTISNIFAFLVAVVFAFLTNKYFVFQSKETKKDYIGKEFITFVSFRLVSMGLETLLLILTVELLHLDDGWMKLVLSVVTVVVNYGFSKWFIFKEKGS